MTSDHSRLTLPLYFAPMTFLYAICYFNPLMFKSSSRYFRMDPYYFYNNLVIQIYFENIFEETLLVIIVDLINISPSNILPNMLLTKIFHQNCQAATGITGLRL